MPGVYKASAWAEGGHDLREYGQVKVKSYFRGSTSNNNLTADDKLQVPNCKTTGLPATNCKTTGLHRLQIGSLITLDLDSRMPLRGRRIFNTWGISGAKHQNLIRLEFASYKAFGGGQINFINLVNVWSFGNSDIPVRDGFIFVLLGINSVRFEGQHIDIGLYFHKEGRASPKKC